MASGDDLFPVKTGSAILSVVSVFLLICLLMHLALDRLDNGGFDLLSKAQEIPSAKGLTPKQLRQSHLKADATANQLKSDFERQYPPSDMKRIRLYVSGLRQYNLPTAPDLAYDIHDCPMNPPKSYPFDWNVMDVLNNWHPDQTNPPPMIHQGLCIFDWEKDFHKATRYREAELPFVIKNQPDLLKASERWNRSEKYLLELLGDRSFKTEHSKDNHMMFWKVRPSIKIPEGWKQPTEITKLSLSQWLNKAREIEKSPNHVDEDHWYFRLNAAYKYDNNFMYDELPIFDPSEASFFMVNPDQQRGINCRFGMKGIIAELHYDMSRNFITVMGGARRYVLAHPRECKHLALHPKGHPSGRHSSVNWSKPDLKAHPEFAKARVNEVVLQAGDALYLPTFWFHFIVSLNLNYQCNARSGISFEYQPEIERCGFVS